MRFGPYILQERLAVGGMAEIFLAVRTDGQRPRRQVVLKRILPQYATDPEFQTLFEDEARLGTLLHHPNIVRMFDHDRIDGVAYITMELVSGRDLGQVLKHGPPMPRAAALHIALQVLEGLAYAHAREENGRPLQIVHRDISPGNILLSYEGEVKIADLGVARAANAAHRTSAGALKGKIPFLSPEQVAARPMDARSDLFSLSVVLYQMLTGSRPFDGKSEMEVLGRIAEGDFLPPSRIAADLPPSLEPVIMKGLAAEPDERFQDAAAFASALRLAAQRARIVPSGESLRDHMGDNFTGRASALSPPGIAADGDDEPATLPSVEVLIDPSPLVRGEGVTLPDRRREPQAVERPARAPGEGTEPPTAPHRSSTPGQPIRAPGAPARRAWGPAMVVLLLIPLLGAAVWWALQPAPRPVALALPAAPPVPTRSVVVLRMAEQQEGWFVQNLLRPYLQSRHVEARIVRFDDITEVPRVLREAGPADLVKVPLPMARALVDQHLVQSITRLATDLGLPGGLSAVTSGFEPSSIALCEYPTIVGRELFFLPRKTELKFLVYQQDAVRAALAAFPEQRAALDQDLRRIGGQGLPRGFVLDDDPESWDWYDLLAVAYVMARTPDPQGRTMPRVARRSHPYWGTVSTVLDMLHALGQQEPAIAPSQTLTDLLSWEAAYRELGLYHPSVYDDAQVLSGRGLYEAMQRGEVYLTTTHSLGVRLLAGNAAEGLTSYLPDADQNLGLATLPRGVSFALGRDGQPVRQGQRAGLVDGWLWGIPASAPSPARSLELLRHLTSQESAQREARAFFLQPVRTDVTLDGSPLADRVAAIVARQLRYDAGAIVPRPSDSTDIVRMRERVQSLWRDVILARAYGAPGRVEREVIEQKVRAVLGP